MAKKYTKSEIEGMIKNLKEKEKKARSKWGKAVLDDAQWLLENVLEWNNWEENQDVELTEKYLLNGAENWKEFSWGGSALIYDGDIAEHYSTPSELKKVGFGKTDMGKDVHGKQHFANYVEKRPNANEEWLDVQARALRQAWWAIRDEMNGTTEFSMSLCEFEEKKGKSNFDMESNGMKLEIYNPKGELVNTFTDKNNCIARLIEMLWVKSEKIEKVKMTSIRIEGEEIATFTEYFSNGYKYVLSGVPMNHGYINATKIVNSNNFSLACGSKSNFDMWEDDDEEDDDENFSIKKGTKKQYEEYLNEIGEGLSEEEFIIGGKMRDGKYGTMLKKYDPIAFNVGYNEWRQNFSIIDDTKDVLKATGKLAGNIVKNTTDKGGLLMF